MCISNIGIIELEGMEFHAFHGCLESEKVRGNLFTVDFKGMLPMERAAESDRLENTVDYGQIYGIIRDEMEKPSDLLENVGWRIAGTIAEQFPEFDCFKVRVSKQNPPVAGRCAWSRVSVFWPDDCSRDIYRKLSL